MSDDGIEVQVKGLDGVRQALREIPRRVGDNAVRSAEYEAMTPMLEAAQANAPVRSGPKGSTRGEPPEPPGFLRQQIRLVRNPRKSRAGAIAVALVVGKKAFYARFVEFGTRFMAAHPFMRTAFDGFKGSVPDRFGKSIWVMINKAVSQVRR